MESAASRSRKQASLAALILLGCGSSQTIAKPEGSALRTMDASGTGGSARLDPRESEREKRGGAQLSAGAGLLAEPG